MLKNMDVANLNNNDAEKNNSHDPSKELKTAVDYLFILNAFRDPLQALPFKEIVRMISENKKASQPRSVASKAIKELEKLDLVKAERPGKKVVAVSLTTRGDQVRQHLNEAIRALSKTEDLSKEEIEELVESFRRLVDRYFSEQSDEVKDLYYEEIKNRLGSPNINVRKALWKDAAWEFLDRFTQVKQELSDDVIELLKLAPFDTGNEKAKKYSELLKRWFEGEGSVERIDRGLDALLNLLASDEFVDLLLEKVKSIDERAWSSLKVRLLDSINIALSRGNWDLVESTRDKIVKMIKDNQGEIKNRFIELYRGLFIASTQV